MAAFIQSKKVWLAVFVLSGLAGATWWERDPIIAWYYVRQLSYAYEEDRESWAKKVADLESVAVPRLLDGLHDPDALVCENLQQPLFLMMKSWGLADPRMQELTEKLHVQMNGFSPAGQEKVVLLLTSLLQLDAPTPLPPQLTKVVGEMLTKAEQKTELRPAALLLAAELVCRVQPGQWVDVARKMAERALKDESPRTRVAGLQLLLREPMRKDKELLEKTIPLLRDREAPVRKNALLVLAGEGNLVREESFMPLLHDEDAEIQFLCESALRKRGLSDDDIKIARMVSDANAATRMRVLYYLRQMPDLNLAGLLTQLSHDPEKAVRAAAVRAAGEFRHIDLSPRLREMAVSDPSETVRQGAHYYLQYRVARAALD